MLIQKKMIKKNKRILILIINLIILIWSATVFFKELNAENISKWKLLSSGIGFLIFVTLIIIYLIKIKNDNDK
tara:strand:+ start:947 stop:1165 length:219 start_codon:yes stop_codon:yes gene_type:complete